ncbi:small ribosomal subunit protein uS14m [Chironomus tepperi]|uniref:small ribosomal subunit protein uS14m n=1 Tax=Chironomus tepperi TaxID=113505 RepID=UPI00391F083E
MSLIKALSAATDSLITSGTSKIFGFTQKRSGAGWTDWRMIKDYKKRMTVKQHAVDRIRVNTLRKNDILPIEIREAASTEIHNNFPRDSNLNRVVYRCMVTSRPRGNLMKFRLSRIMFRHFADYNKLSGVQRAMW